MSVRRLADEAVQPAEFAFSADMSTEVDKWIAKYPAERKQSAVIPLLMLAQDQEGWVTRAAIEHVADMLGMPKIRVMEVATFYTQYQLQPVGTRAHVQVCGTTPCMLRGAEDLISVCKSKIHDRQFHRNGDGTLSWEEVECQGACVNAPMVMIGKDTFEDLTPERLAEIIDAFEGGKGDTIAPGPQIDRIYSAPFGGPLTLTGDATVAKSKAKASAKGADRAAAQTVPSNAGRPKTQTAETSTAINGPAARKVSAKAEAAASAEPAPEVSAGAANTRGLTEPKQAKGGGQRKPGEETQASAPSSSASFMDKSVAGKAANAPAKTGKMAKPKVAAATKDTAKSGAVVAAEAPSLNDKNRPAGIEKPAAIDDLKMISGIGPKIEGILHVLGIFTFAQVASWKKAEREWVDGYLRFKGRIDREDWVKQAKALAKGGRDEYVKVFGKEPR